MAAKKSKPKSPKRRIGFTTKRLKLNPTKTRSGAPITFQMIPIKES